MDTDTTSSHPATGGRYDPSQLECTYNTIITTYNHNMLLNTYITIQIKKGIGVHNDPLSAYNNDHIYL